ncbi:MAG TPA: UDP-N-acetylglucosamine 2-epimerase (non-hydrolyzing) [Solirubrobacteraceae bacterium]|jgi:UDP-N-acetylglucosamine 2-epimerase (non-hydrolysing)/UDP-GlcNAc3NAcA epimerase|nr:UDP-N-acetylglucosamine 2-epimerase (non-hydrolyzing) [Solirubrobacteraceae bacterium]
MRVMTVVGNRPQFIKAAAVSRGLRRVHEELLVHTGQHHDPELSEVFFDELELPGAEHRLELGGGTNTEQTARMLEALDPLLSTERPDCVLVYGDTNSTLAGGLAAAQRQVPVVHVEAGMRSFDPSMPEELNRVLTDHLSSLLLCSSDTAVGNLKREAVRGQAVLVGDVMVDVWMAYAERARGRKDVLADLDVAEGEYVLATAHRAGNVDDPERLRALVELLLALPGPVLVPLHPRTRARLGQAGLIDRLADSSSVVLLAPLGYVEFTALLLGARAVVTDSGGVQKEAYLAGRPCLTLRDRTEWVETVQTGWNELVDLDVGRARAALEREAPRERPELYGDGRAGERVVEALARLETGRPGP